LRSDLFLVDLVDPFPFIFQFAPLVYNGKEGERDIIGDLKVPDDYRGKTSTWSCRIFNVEESTGLIDWEISTLNQRALNVEKSTNTVGEASTWNRRIFDVDE